MGFTGDISPLYSELYQPLLIIGNFRQFFGGPNGTCNKQVVDLKPNGRTLFLGEFGRAGGRVMVAGFFFMVTPIWGPQHQKETAR